MCRWFAQWLFLGILLPSAAHALSPEALSLVGKRVKGGAPMTLSEVSAMPPACHAIGMGEVNGVFWAEAMNQNGTISILERPEYSMARNAVWFHHYCWGMLDKYRAFASDKASTRDFLIKIWRGEMEYIVNWTAKEKINWAYLPLVHKEIAESYLQENDIPNALRAANKALELNAEYVPAYNMLAEIYERAKDKIKALSAVTEGLRQAPESKSLQRRYKELGGKMPFPEPYAKKETAPVEAVAESTAPAATASSAPAAEAPPASTPTEPVPQQPPGNPYCRFCP